MRIKILACLALAVCIFAVPVSAKDKNKTADMFLNGWEPSQFPIIYISNPELNSY